MKQEDIIRMARECGMDTIDGGVSVTVKANSSFIDNLSRFANLVAQHYEKQIAVMQAKIDALMWEYCPEDMTEEQRNEWALHQVLSTHAANIDYERLTKIGDVISGKEV